MIGRLGLLAGSADCGHVTLERRRGLWPWEGGVTPTVTSVFVSDTKWHLSFQEVVECQCGGEKNG